MVLGRAGRGGPVYNLKCRRIRARVYAFIFIIDLRHGRKDCRIYSRAKEIRVKAAWNNTMETHFEGIMLQRKIDLLENRISEIWGTNGGTSTGDVRVVRVILVDSPGPCPCLLVHDELL